MKIISLEEAERLASTRCGRGGSGGALQLEGTRKMLQHGGEL